MQVMKLLEDGDVTECSLKRQEAAGTLSSHGPGKHKWANPDRPMCANTIRHYWHMDTSKSPPERRYVSVQRRASRLHQAGWGPTRPSTKGGALSRDNDCNMSPPNRHAAPA